MITLYTSLIQKIWTGFISRAIIFASIIHIPESPMIAYWSFTYILGHCIRKALLIRWLSKLPLLVLPCGFSSTFSVWKSASFPKSTVQVVIFCIFLVRAIKVFYQYTLFEMCCILRACLYIFLYKKHLPF